ncbi:transposase [Streptomyces sp. NPDC092307]|uniref:transposase n=1 Tax=Streptomyces sp. NPDC092307 TaxID=3366013 RepID=UPI0038101FAD
MAPGESLAAAARARIVFEDEAGFSMTPPRARTWGRRGHTPVVLVRGRSRRRTSVVALCCYKPGEQSRLIHRPPHPPPPQGRTQELLLEGLPRPARAHIQLGGPIVVVWDDLNAHLAAGLKRYETEHDWLTTVRLPPYSSSPSAS